MALTEANVTTVESGYVPGSTKWNSPLSLAVPPIVSDVRGPLHHRPDLAPGHPSDVIVAGRPDGVQHRRPRRAAKLQRGLFRSAGVNQPRSTMVSCTCSQPARRQVMQVLVVSLRHDHHVTVVIRPPSRRDERGSAGPPHLRLAR